MEPIRTVRSKVAPLPFHDVDTDQIIPKQFLKRVERTGFGEFLFWDWRGVEGYRLHDPAHRGRRDPGRGTQLRLWLLA